MTGLNQKKTDFRSELAAANINPDSCLATDYLNHFNEIVMLLEMAIDMPDLMDEAASWQPTTYVEHFEGSGFAARDLVIKAYGLAQPRVRTRFEGVISRLDELILSILNMLSQAGQANGAFDSHTRYVFSKGQAEVQRHLSMLNGIIHNLSDDSGPGEQRNHLKTRLRVDQMLSLRMKLISFSTEDRVVHSWSFQAT